MLAAARERTPALCAADAGLASAGQSAGLFGYHALYFAALKLAPPAEANLIASLWALFTVLFSGLLPGAHVAPRARRRRAARAGGSDAAGVGQTGRGRAAATGEPLGFALAFGCALVWSSYSVASRLLGRGARAKACRVACLATSALAFVSSLTVRDLDAPPAPPGWRWRASGSAPSAPRSCCGTSA